jgi:hypothetical protein
VLNTISRAVIAATGNAIFTPPAEKGADPCDHFFLTPAIFDLRIMAKDYMNQFKDPVTRERISDLAENTRSAMARVLAPSLKRGVPNQEIAVVMFAQYLPVSQVSLRVAFRLTVQNQKVAAEHLLWQETHQSDVPVFYHWGDISKDFIDRMPPTSTFKMIIESALRVSQLDVLKAMQAASDLIHRASREYSQIGGPVQAYLLGKPIKPQPLTPETR